MQYITRSSEGIEVCKNGRKEMIGKGMISYVNSLCIDNFSTYQGRKEAVSKLLKERNNIPIYVNDSVFLYPTKAIRDFSVFLINYFEVLSIRKVGENLVEINFDDLTKLVIDANYSKLSRQHDRIKRILLKMNKL